MNKLRRMLSLAFGVLFLVCVTLFAASCFGNDEKKYSLTVEYNSAQGTVLVNDKAVTSNAAESYAEGEKITLTVQANEDYSVDAVTVGGEAVTLTESS